MRNLKFLLPLLLLAISACTSSRTLEDGKEYECIGAFDDPEPGIKYSTSGKNVALAVLFSETIVVPVVVVATETKCPVRLVPTTPSQPTVGPAR